MAYILRFLSLWTVIYLKRNNTTSRSLTDASVVSSYSTCHVGCVNNDKFYVLWWKASDLWIRLVHFKLNQTNKYCSVSIITFLTHLLEDIFSGKQLLFVHPKWIRHQTGIKHFPFKKQRKIRYRFWNDNVKIKINLFSFSLKFEIYCLCSRVWM